MKKENFTHLKYKPNNKIYNLVKSFNHLKYGNVIGYVSEDGYVYFRLESDFEKFDFLTQDDFKYIESESYIRVKFKLDGEWKPYVYKGLKLFSFEEYINQEIIFLESELNKIYNRYYEKFDYYFNLDVDLENKIWNEAKKNKFDEMEFQQQKMIFIKEKIKFINELLERINE